LADDRITDSDGAPRHRSRAMTTSTPSSYAFDNAMVEGRRRLALLENILDPGTFRRLERIDVKPGSRCLELGAGGGSVTEWLCNRVGGSGHVTAVDLDARFIRALEFKNLEVLEENVMDNRLAPDSYDLVHTRWTLLHIPQREAVLARLGSLLKPGGRILLEEADGLPVDALDESPFGQLCKRVFPTILPRGSDAHWAHRLPQIVAAAGLAVLSAEADWEWFRGGSPVAEFWKISWTRVRDAVAAAGGDVTQWDRELAALDDPTILSVHPATISVIATK
jgi:SAM-dependent methyltransferase